MNQKSRDRAAAYLGSLREKDGSFRFCAANPPSLMATCYALLGLESASALQGMPVSLKEESLAYLLSCLQKDGRFVDPANLPGTRLDSGHDERYFTDELQCFSEQAMDALGAGPEAFGRILRRHEPPEAFLKTLSWRDPWMDANRLLFYLSRLCVAIDGKAMAPGGEVDRALRLLESRQDPRTGFWQGSATVASSAAMAASCHFIYYYTYLHKPLPRSEQMIASCLSLQGPDGLFSADSVGHSCFDYDALAILREAERSGAKDREDAVGACRRKAQAALLGLQNPDGGFPHFRERVFRPLSRRLPFLRWKKAALGTYHNGSVPLACPVSESNAATTWFRLMALTLTEEQSEKKSFRRLPFLGYHP